MTDWRKSIILALVMCAIHATFAVVVAYKVIVLLRLRGGRNDSLSVQFVCYEFDVAVSLTLTGVAKLCVQIRYSVGEQTFLLLHFAPSDCVTLPRQDTTTIVTLKEAAHGLC